MTHIYYIILVLTALTSSVTTLYYPNIIARYRQYKTAKQRRLERMIRTEVEKQLKEIIADDK
jgi:hypothetical protein